MLFLLKCALYHVALISMFYAFYLLPPGLAASELGWLTSFAKLMPLIFIGIALMVRPDLLLINKGLNSQIAHGTTTLTRLYGKFEYYARAIAFMILMVIWPVAILLWGQTVHFLIRYYLIAVGLVISLGYFEFLTCNYDKYLDLTSRGKWGPVSKVRENKNSK